MKYILLDGYIDEISFIGTIECKNNTCTEYNGSIPDGFNSLEEWHEIECLNDRLNAWKIVDGNLVFDSARNEDLQELYKKQEEDNRYVCHKELFEVQQQIEVIQDVSESQYKKQTATGQVITIDNVKKVYPKVKLTNIDPYSFSKIDLVTTGKNMLKNEATTQTINGVKFTQNKDRSIKINGTSTAEIEYNIAGTSNNTSAFLCFKKNKSYYISGLKNQTLKMYYFDGTNRTQIYSGTDGTITFTDSDKLVTQIVLSIPNETTINNVTIYPQLEYGDTATNYEEYKGTSILSFDFSEYIEEGLFPSDDLYPNDDLYPMGTTIDYIVIEKGNISALINDELVDITNGNVNLFDGYDTIYSFQDTNIEIEYSINVLDVDNLDYMRGKATTTNKFKVLEDGSIEAHNGYFSGTINAEGGNFSGNIYLEDDTTYSCLTVKSIDPDETHNHQNSATSYYQGNGFFIFSDTYDDVSMSCAFHNGVPMLALDDGIDYTNILPEGITTPTVTQTSLAERKKNFELLENALEIIKTTDIYKYHLLKQKDDDKKHIGFVIGENYNYSKEITSLDENGKEVGADIYSMVSVCFKAIKEQQEQIEKLKEEIANLKKESDK